MKRTRRERKLFKRMIETLDLTLGEHDSGLLIATILDIFELITEGKDEVDVRTLEIKINDYFWVKHNFESNEVKTWKD